MKKTIHHTKVVVKLRKSEYDKGWQLTIEAYPVLEPGATKPKRVRKSTFRTITTPIWDKSKKTRYEGYIPKRDINGIIQCRSALDQESCIYADNIRKLRQHEYDTAITLTADERMQRQRRNAHSRTLLPTSRRLHILIIQSHLIPLSSTGEELGNS